MTGSWWLAGLDNPHGNLAEAGEEFEQVARAADVSVQTLRRLTLGLPVSDEAKADVARAIGVSPEVLSKLSSAPDQFDSVFISYGHPDEPFARLLWEALSERKIKVFFFPETAIPGKRLHRTMSEGVYEYDRILLVCSETSLSRSGVLNEIELLLTREAAEGGASLLIPVTVDDFLFVGWQPERLDLRAQVTSRVVADFRGATERGGQFVERAERLIRALQRESPLTKTA